MFEKYFLEVPNDRWVSTHEEYFEKNFIRFEYLTASHIQDDVFDIFSKLSTFDLNENVLLKTQISGVIQSLENIYLTASFHERELSQMFGISVIGAVNNDPAFDIVFNGYPLRRDFALTTRQETTWPGSVELDANSRRRQTLPPGIFKIWNK